MIGPELGHDFLSQRLGLGSVLIIDTGNQHTGGHTDEQRGDLTHHRIANRQNRKQIRRFASFHLVVHDPDRDASHEVDAGDDQASNGIALDELHGAVHTAMQLTFHSQGRPAGPGFVARDVACPEVRINAHLFAWHRIQREPRTHFSHALGTLGDHDELNDRDHQEHDNAHGQVTPHHQLAESENDVPCVGMHENRLGGSDVQPEAEQGGEQQQRREGCQGHRIGHVDGDAQKQHADRHVDGKQSIDGQGRQRKNHQRQDRHDGEHHAHIAAQVEPDVFQHVVFLWSLFMTSVGAREGSIGR